MAISQNKLTPLLVGAAALIVGYALYSKFSSPAAPVASGSAMRSIPQPGVDPASAPKSSGLLGNGGSSLPAVRPGDADNSAETLAQVIASNKELRDTAQKALERLAELERKNGVQSASQRADARNAVVDPAAAAAPMGAPAVTPAPAPGAAPEPNDGNPLGALLDNGMNAAAKMMGFTGPNGKPASTPNAGINASTSGMPSGLGYDGTGVGIGSANPAAPDAPPSTALTKLVAPMGYRTASANGERGTTLVRSTLAPAAPVMPLALSDPMGAAAASGNLKPEPVPYFTIPENATLPRVTTMTTLVGRVPIDGRVQDPVPFKVIIGRDNLAASGAYVADDIAGVVASGIAVGDMSLSCVEGFIQSLTFIFDDGTVRTVSQRMNGASGGFGTGSGGGVSLSATNKLGWLSDQYGNPCIPGKFETDAPRYLTEVIGGKALSAAGAAYAQAQTTTVNSSGPLGATSTSQVTGSVGKNVLGKVVGNSANELTDWLMRRLDNSFDAVVVRAGTRVAVHIEQSINIDKDPDGRKLDYARDRAKLAQQQGVRHGID